MSQRPSHVEYDVTVIAEAPFLAYFLHFEKTKGGL
jgi:hypothetical protein